MGNVEIITLSGKGQIVLPKKVREELGVDKGSKLLLVEKGGKVTLTKVDSLLRARPFTALASEKALAKHWLSREDDKAWKDL